MTLVTDHLALLAGAPNGIKKLRELILELAVRGQLVPQDADDEPASELLKRIDQGKARLQSSGELKKQKPLLKIESTDEPHDLPLTWAWTRLGEVTNFGTTTKVKKIPDDAWILDLEDIEKDTSRLLERRRFSERNSLSDKNRFSRNDVLYGKLRPYLNKSLVADADGFCTTEILPFRCHGPFDSHYFKLALMSPYFLRYVNGKSYGMKMPRLGTEDGRQAAFPLPPLAEQHRIVAKVDELMALCDTLETQQANAESAHAKLVQALLESLTQASDADDFAASWQRLSEHFDTLFTTETSIDALKQTVLQLAVTGRLTRAREAPLKDGTPRAGFPTLPADWAYVPFNNLIDQERPIAYGVLVPGPETQGGVPLVRIADLSLSTPSELPRKTISHEVDAQFSRTRLKGGEILMGVVGSVGKLGYAPASWAGANIARAVCRIVPNTMVSHDYVLQLLQSDLMRRQFLDDTRTLAQPTLNIGLIRSAQTPLSPLAEQHRIVARVDELMSLCDQLKSSIHESRDLNQQLATTLVERAVA